MNASTLAVLLATFCVSLTIVGYMRRYALQRDLIDFPNVRSSHTSPTPRGGGVAIVVSFAIAALVLFLSKIVDTRTTVALIGGGGAIACVGFLDDRRHLSAKLRFFVHLAAAIFVVVLIGGLPDRVLARWAVNEAWIGSAAGVVALAWGTNLFNFMDGIDGIAGSEAVFISTAGAFLNWLSGGDPGLTAAMLCLSVACLGFLVLNWPPARIFMGDVGSGFLGFELTTLGLAACHRGKISMEVWLILGGVFFVDSTITLLRRIIRGDRWSEPHRMHAYQHLARRLGAHKPATVIVMAVNACWLLPWAYCANGSPDHAGIFLAAALSPIIVSALWLGAGRPDR